MFHTSGTGPRASPGSGLATRSPETTGEPRTASTGRTAVGAADSAASPRDTVFSPVDAFPSSGDRAVNHVPDDVLDALDAFGEGLLAGTPPAVDERLRGDLRVGIRPAGDGETARCRYETEHTRTPRRLRDRGPFVTTIVDGVDERLRLWGVDPPGAYEYAGTVETTHRYEGTLRLP